MYFNVVHVVLLYGATKIRQCLMYFNVVHVVLLYGATEPC